MQEFIPFLFDDSLSLHVSMVNLQVHGMLLLRYNYHVILTLYYVRYLGHVILQDLCFTTA